MSEAPLVTVLIPVRNEEADIERCLRGVLAQDHPHDRMEIVLVDGYSTDRTSAIAEDVLSGGDVPWTLLKNPVGTTPSNLNAGLAVAAGDILCRVDARSIIPPEYVRLCASVLTSRPDVAVTGGAQVAVAFDKSARSIGIARALNNRYAMGGSRYRRGANSGQADTVYLGAFRSQQLRAVGGWDVRMLTNQDFALNRRLSNEGLVWFDSRLEISYKPRNSFSDLWRQYRRFGMWKVRYWRMTGDRPQPRQWLLILAPGIVAAVALAAALRRGNRLRSIGRAWAVAAVTLVAVDEIAATDSVELRARLVSVASVGIVGTAWIFGVVEENLRAVQARNRRR